MAKNNKPNTNANQVNNNLITVYPTIIRPSKTRLTINPNSVGLTVNSDYN